MTDPNTVRDVVDRVGKRMDDHGHHVYDRPCACYQCKATVLAAIGYPSSTIGSGSRSSDSTSSTERALGLGAAADSTRVGRGQFADLDTSLAEAGRVLYEAAERYDRLIGLVVELAPDDDPIPPGTGACTVDACERFCNPRKNPDDRLKSGLCPACHRAWLRWRTNNPTGSRSEYARHRTRTLTEPAR